MSFLNSLKSLLSPAPRVELSAAAARIEAGDACLVDVREPDEWKRGVAKGAVLLPLSDLSGRRARWAGFLARSRNKEILLYCASGMRSARAVQILAAEGFRAANVGGMNDIAAAGWRLTPPEQ